jgi:tetratricopeptide (TPR) repeat protein
VALAATVLLALTLGGGGWLWLKADRDAQRVQAMQDVNEALNRATALREQAKADRVGGAALFTQARDQVQRARELLQSSPAVAALQAQVRHLQTELDEEEKDRTLLAALDAARLAQAATAAGEHRFAVERAVPLFREALRAYGLAAGEGEPEAVAERIRQRPRAVREAITATLDEWIELAANPRYKITEPHLGWLKAVAAAAAPADGWTREFRAACAEKDVARRRQALEKMAEAADVRNLPARAVTLLAFRLRDAGAGASAARLLRQRQQQYPGDFWANHDLGMVLAEMAPPQRDEAVGFLRAAVALRPDSSGAHLNLGNTLMARGQLDEAIAGYRKALALDPKDAMAHINLGVALHAKGRLDEAIACYRKALELDPKNAQAHTNLGIMLSNKGQLDEAIACWRRALELDPQLVQAHYNLGHALAGKGRLDEAIACWRKVLQLNPRHAQAHTALGTALASKGQMDDAIACWRKAIQLDPKDARAHTNLGVVLCRQGRLDEAIACYRQALELDPKDATVRRSLARTERLAAARDKLLAFQDGSYTPATSDERLALAEWCQFKKLHRTAAGLYAAAFAADPRLADDLEAAHRYKAARRAALAAAGQGEDAAKLDDRERARLRRQALDWLRADLALWGKQLASGRAADLAAVQRVLRDWQQDGDLAGLRDPAALAKLPAEERAAFTQLWADVAALLQRAEAPAKEEGKR